MLKTGGVRVMSLDHDLGGDHTSRAVVLWMCEHEVWPDEVSVHSANPVGVEWLTGMINRYHPRL
ncbi:cyclic-phosphate processing receiver domain-containing protein [Rhodococcus pyridinivorans]|uniref:cyclic-phosphate processing receiver domain-containing protein n=1 Tax=Rhodococcus pyridinivorans TaxID=103816 RepID=UPI0027D32F47|nr:cyclic-phosphate processing receiver domain-containing protein [Rhodococcus pyridinivorans]